MGQQIEWKDEVDVVVVGYGGAGAATAITAHDAGVRVLVLEKQPSDTPRETRHTPSTRMCGGAWFCPTDLDKAILYLEGLVKIANETLDAERKELIRVFAHYSVSTSDWLQKMGVEIGGGESRIDHAAVFGAASVKTTDKGIPAPDFPALPGSDCAVSCVPKTTGNFRSGAALFKSLSEAVQKRGIPVMWGTPAKHLITQNGQVCGVAAINGDRQIGIKARRAVVLTSGGFEFNQCMIENYLGVRPVHFYGNPGNTGDGISMAMEVGANLWHMNDVSWRVTMKFPDFPIAFGTQHHEIASILVDKRGRRFTNERFKLHAFGYELTNYDCYAMCYPRVPCYWIFGEERRVIAPLASLHGACNPPGGIMGDIHYVWSADNQQEIDRGWIMKSNNLDDLASRILADPDNNGLMSPSVLCTTVKQYDDYCRKGEDLDFHKDKEWLKPIQGPPFYAVKLWPGGPNTEGGPKRNVRGQVMRVDNAPVPRLYSAGELGSVWGMIYQSAANITECVAFGRIAGANAAAEKIWE